MPKIQLAHSPPNIYNITLKDGMFAIESRREEISETRWLSLRQVD